MLKNLKKIIQNLQTTNESKKKRWLFILSALAMILVIGSWIIYLNKTIVNLNPLESTPINESSIQISKESPWQVFTAGLKTITSQIKELAAATNKISIEANPSNFASSSEEIIPKQ